MKHTFFSLLLTLVLLLPAQAQDAQQVTVREIHAISQENIDQLQAGGANLDATTVPNLIFNDLNGQRVQVTGVILTDPFNSGGATPGDDGQPGRVHVFIRDTAAVSQGVAGMGLHMVDGGFQTTGLLNFAIGDVVTVTGTISPFNTVIQIAPETIQLEGFYADLGLPDSLLDPVVITTDMMNQAVGDGGVQTNWENLPDLRNQFVRIENATVQARANIDQDRVDFYITSDDGSTVANFYDTSIRFRNDRSNYAPTFNVRSSEDGDFVPPPPGSLVNMQGFVLFQPGADQIGRSQPADIILSIVPFEDRGCGDPDSGLRCDLEVTETPPIITELSKPDFVPGADPITVSFKVDADPLRTLDVVELKYITSGSTDTMAISAVLADTAYIAEIPGVEDGTFVTYFVEATDNTGALSVSPPLTYRVLVDGINEIQDLRRTADDGFGDSPFAGVTTDMNIVGVVMSDPIETGFLTIQDGTDPWSGIAVQANETLLTLNLQPGDSVLITNATVQQIRGDMRFDRSGDVTGLSDVTIEMTGTGEPLDPVVVTTDVLLDETIAEAHEAMLVRFENVTVTSDNPDAPAGPFGEFAVSSDGTEDNAFRVDDASLAVSQELGSSLEVGSSLDFLQGIVTFTFGNFKLLPRGQADFPDGTAIDVPTERDDLPSKFALKQNYPNPFNPQTTIEYNLASSGQVTLEVVDLLGQRVALLVSEDQTAGTHTVRFDARGLASGLYLYRITAGSQTLTKRMMVLK